MGLPMGLISFLFTMALDYPFWSYFNLNIILPLLTFFFAQDGEAQENPGHPQRWFL